MALLFAPVLFVILLIFVAYPFLSDRAETAGKGEDNREMEWKKLLAEKEDAIATLKDIDMDYRMGKLSEEDYQNLKAQYEESAVAVLKNFEAAEKARAKPRS